MERVARVALMCCSFVAFAFAQAQQPAKARLTGHVCDETGQPIAGAAVGTIAWSQFVDTPALLAHPATTSDANGDYAIEVAADSALVAMQVVVAAPKRQACAIRIPYALALEGQALAVAVLVPGASLTGRVRDAQGKPLAGVQVQVTSSIQVWGNDSASLRTGAVSDASGIFHVPCVPRTGMRLVARLTGYASEARLVAQETPVDLTLRATGMVRGKVVDADGKPVAGVRVGPVIAETLDDGVEAESAADGTFALTAPAVPRFRLIGHDSDNKTRWESALLRGPADDVVLRAGTGDVYTVTAIDAATKAPIAAFALTAVTGDSPTTAMWQHSMQRTEYVGLARVPRVATNGQSMQVIVTAPGYAYELAPVPEDVKEPLVVALGPECVLTGTVVDAETKQPLAGVAVRALPKGDSNGGGGTADTIPDKTDRDGHYRVGNLKPGEYQVQAHAVDRPSSAPQFVTIEAGKPAQLDLTAPARIWVEFELTGTLPEGLPCETTFGWSSSYGVEGFTHAVAEPPPLRIQKAGIYTWGPVDTGSRSLQLFVPSRTRVGTGTTLTLGRLEAGAKRTTIELPALVRRIVRGRIAIDGSVPTERLAVVARAQQQADRRRSPFTSPNVAGVDGGGNFELDLPTGDYRVQVVDLATGIACWQRDLPWTVDDKTTALELKPEWHWLELDVRPQQEGGVVSLVAFGITLPAGDSFLQSWGQNNGVEIGTVQFRAGDLHQRWLVPAAHVGIEAYQTFDMLRPDSQGYQSHKVDSADADITGKVTRATLTIPPPPPDAELERRQ